MLNEIVKDIASTVKDSVQAGITALSEKFEPRIKQIEDRFNALPVPKDGEPGKDGQDGRSVTIDDVRPLVKELVDAIEIPVPVKGQDGTSVTLDDVLPVIDEAVTKAAQIIKVPQVDYDAVKQIISQEVSAIPKPLDGKSITVDDVAPLLKELVEAIEIPVPEKGEKGDAGESITIEDVRPIVDVAVDKAVQDIEVPKVDYEVVKQFIGEQVSQIPVPKDGKSITVDDVAPMIKGLVDAIEIPVPEQGAKGEDGKSITVDDVKPLVIETVKAAVAEMPLPKDGDPGKDADPIDMDAVQKMIAAAVESAVTASVERAVAKIHIPSPKDGEDGKDALNIEILPAIDAEKSYSRNTYAIHKGGLWRSYERTNGMRGWETVVDGIADIQIEYDGERGVKIITEKSSGEIVAKEFNVPAMIYKGVWKEGTFYKGDTCTYAGSLWTCLEETTGKPGDGSKSWQLSAKKGRDANSPVKVK